MQVHKNNKVAVHIYKKNGFSIKETSPWDEDFWIMEYIFDINKQEKEVGTFYNSNHIEIRTMTYDDIPAVCRADNDESAENIARKYNRKVYLDVCLNSDYGPAQRFYVKRGYVPDGKGVYYEEKVCETDAVCKNDDELTLCLVKKL